jgi:hypothetical protein
MPFYQIPSVERMRDTLLPNLFKKTKEAVQNKLSQASSVAMIMDIWSSKSMEGYIGLSASFVTDSFEPFVCLLALRRIYGRHTGEAIAAEYDAIAREWNIPNKVITEFDV